MCFNYPFKKGKRMAKVRHHGSFDESSEVRFQGLGFMNSIHPTAVIGPEVRLGKNNRILPYSVLTGPLDIGDDNIIGPHVVLGSDGADTRAPRHDSSKSAIRIGSRNIIREFTAIQKPCYRDLTLIGNDVFIMQGASLSHDVILEDKVVVTAMVVLAGITRILEGANLGMGCTVNQYCVIGQYSIVATGAAAMKNVKPFSRYIPGKPLTVNEYAIKKFGFADFADEIRRYVLQGAAPRSEWLSVIVDRYRRLAQESGKGEYGV